jgi:hypothetical protein
VLVVEFALEAVEHIAHLAETRLLQRKARLFRAVAAAADQDDRAIDARRFLDVSNEIRVDVSIGTVVPWNHHGTDRMADEQELHLAAAVDEQRERIFFQELMGFFRRQMIHNSLALGLFRL